MNLNIILEVVKSFVAANNKKYGSSKCLGVKAHRQFTSFSCCAAVYQMVAHYYGFKVSHLKAIKLTKCYPNGSSLVHVARVLKREHGLSTKSLRTRKQIRNALQNGQPVITHDELSYEHDHAILLVGQTPKGFWLADPVLGQIHWKNENRVMAAASEFIAVGAP